MMQDEAAEKLSYLAERNQRMRRWFHARQPQPIGKVVAQVVLKNRYAAGESNAALETVWESIVGQEVAKRAQPTGIARGKFEVTVAHSIIAQELSFDAGRITKKLQEAFPETKITGVRYRVGIIK